MQLNHLFFVVCSLSFKIDFESLFGFVFGGPFILEVSLRLVKLDHQSSHVPLLILHRALIMLRRDRERSVPDFNREIANQFGRFFLGLLGVDHKGLDRHLFRCAFGCGHFGRWL